MMTALPLHSESPVTVFLRPSFGITVHGGNLSVSVRARAAVHSTHLVGSQQSELSAGGRTDSLQR
jgi:hypothetical protein